METKRLSQYKVPVFHTKIDGGPDVVTIYEEDDPLVYWEAFFDVGSSSDAIPGTAHLLEHLICEGPARQGIHPALKDLSVRAVEGNAATTRYSTEYYLEGFHKDSDEIFYALARMVAEFDPASADIMSERDVVQKEILEGERSNAYSAIEYGHVFPHAPELAVPIAGTRESVERIGVEDIRSFFLKTYAKERLLIICKGQVKHEDALRLVTSSSFMRLPRDERAKYAWLSHRPVRAIIHRDVVSSPGISIFLPAAEMQGVDDYALGIAMSMLTDIPLGLLHRKLRTQEKLVYSVGGSRCKRPQIAFRIEAKSASVHFERIEFLVFQEIDRLATGDYPEDLLLRIRNRRRKHFATTSKRPSAHDSWVELWWLWSETDERSSEDRILSVTKDDISRAVAKYWKRENAAVLHLLPA